MDSSLVTILLTLFRTDCCFRFISAASIVKNTPSFCGGGGSGGGREIVALETRNVTFDVENANARCEGVVSTGSDDGGRFFFVKLLRLTLPCDANLALWQQNPAQSNSKEYSLTLRCRCSKLESGCSFDENTEKLDPFNHRIFTGTLSYGRVRISYAAPPAETKSPAHVRLTKASIKILFEPKSIGGIRYWNNRSMEPLERGRIHPLTRESELDRFCPKLDYHDITIPKQNWLKSDTINDSIGIWICIIMWTMGILVSACMCVDGHRAKRERARDTEAKKKRAEEKYKLELADYRGRQENLKDYIELQLKHNITLNEEELDLKRRREQEELQEIIDTHQSFGQTLRRTLTRRSDANLRRRSSVTTTVPSLKRTNSSVSLPRHGSVDTKTLTWTGGSVARGPRSLTRGSQTQETVGGNTSVVRKGGIDPGSTVGQPAPPRCAKGHPLVHSSLNYSKRTEWTCDVCKKVSQNEKRSACFYCEYSLCDACLMSGNGVRCPNGHELEYTAVNYPQDTVWTCDNCHKSVKNDNANVGRLVCFECLFDLCVHCAEPMIPDDVDKQWHQATQRSVTRSVTRNSGRRIGFQRPYYTKTAPATSSDIKDGSKLSVARTSAMRNRQSSLRGNNVEGTENFRDNRIEVHGERPADAERPTETRSMRRPSNVPNSSLTRPGFFSVKRS